MYVQIYTGTLKFKNLGRTLEYMLNKIDKISIMHEFPYEQANNQNFCGLWSTHWL